METYFYNNPQIRKWINQIIERIFTVCILTGVDSDEEFQKGCQIVMKLTSLLKETPTIPSEFLADGVKQLLEQQLPDARVIKNFPEFQVIMEKMLHEGILKATDTTQKKEDFNSDSPIEVPYIEGVTDSRPMELSSLSMTNSDIQHIKEETHVKAEFQVLAEALALAKANDQALAEALAQAEAQAKADAQAFAEALAQTEKQARADAQVLTEALAQAEVQAKADAQALAEALAQAEAQAKAQAADAQLIAEALARADTLEQAEAHARADAQALTEALAQAETQARANAQALAEALIQAETQAKADAQALADALAQVDTKLEAITMRERYELGKSMSSMNDYWFEHEPQPVELMKVPAILTSINSKISQLFSSSLVPQQADLLGKVLSNIFPNRTVYWNKSLMGQTFLAQVEDILICLHDPEQLCDLKKFKKDGWKVLVYNDEDLTFPRRLERQIRQIQRSGKISETV